MDIAVNKTIFEDWKNHTNIEDETLSIVSHFLHLYAYLIIGPMLVLVNIPVFLTVMIRKALRTSYLILAIVFLNNALSGMSAIFIGMKRLIISSLEEHHVVHHDCLLDVPLFLLTTFLLNGCSLLMNSADRLCVVTFPVYYYIHQKRIIYSLIATQYAVALTAVISTALASLIEPVRYVYHFCILQDVYSTHFYVTLTLLSSITSLFSIILIIIVVVMLKKKFSEQFLSSHSYNRDLTQFLKNQKRYTYTTLISCCFTFFLVVVPSIVQNIYMMDSTIKAQIIVMCCVYLPFFNPLNIVMIFICRQKDLQRTVIHGFQWTFCKKKNYVHPVVTTGLDE
uniref:G-protein coupled receptors family 1 profile domain-containing protein n=1 Tax=Onchocerca volvulus TaxID=6282 RepID=A0A8R1XQI4_ONCVO